MVWPPIRDYKLAMLPKIEKNYFSLEVICFAISRVEKSSVCFFTVTVSAFFTFALVVGP